MSSEHSGLDVPTDPAGVAAFIEEFEARRLPKPRWTHHAHLMAGYWYLTRLSPAQALDVMRERIRAHNESVGTANTDSSGYHESITRLYLDGIAAHMASNRDAGFGESLRLLLRGPMADSGWPLKYYSRARLFSVAARRDWLEPDLQPLERGAGQVPAAASRATMAP
jgi:hypothetical protein